MHAPHVRTRHWQRNTDSLGGALALTLALAALLLLDAWMGVSSDATVAANSRTSTHERTRKSHEPIGARAQCGGERVRSAVCRARPPSARTYYLFVDADALLPAVHAAHAAAVLEPVANRALRRLRPIKMRTDDMSRTSKLRANAVALDPS